MHLKQFALLPGFVLDHLGSLFERLYLVTVNSYQNIFSHNPCRVCRGIYDYSLYHNGFSQFILFDLFTQGQTK